MSKKKDSLPVFSPGQALILKTPSAKELTIQYISAICEQMKDMNIVITDEYISVSGCINKEESDE